MTKDEIIIDLKEKNPTMRSGNDTDGYVEYTAEEYEAQINEWADYLIEDAETKAIAAADKAALLERLGLTEEEARLLLS